MDFRWTEVWPANDEQLGIQGEPHLVLLELSGKPESEHHTVPAIFSDDRWSAALLAIPKSGSLLNRRARRVLSRETSFTFKANRPSSFVRHHQERNHRAPPLEAQSAASNNSTQPPLGIPHQQLLAPFLLRFRNRKLQLSSSHSLIERFIRRLPTC